MATKKKQTLGPLIWAVDPAAEDPRTYQNVAKALGALSKQTGAKIQPVTVITERQNELLVNLFARAELWSYESAVPDMVQALVKKLKIKDVSQPILLTSRDSGRRQAVKTLIDYAKKQRASMIVVGSHSRQGLSRLVLGSFAETICQISRVPVLVVNPQTPVPDGFKHVLYTTDFSAESKLAFKEMLPLLKAMGAKVSILHQVEFPLIPVSEYDRFRSADGSVMAKEYAKRQKKKYGPKMKDLQALAKKAGVVSKVVVEDKMQAISDSILQYANNEKIDVIAMPSKSGPVSSVLLGSVAQQVLRGSRKPIWIVHAPSK